MSGSRRWFGYEDDQGRTWGVQLDESNSEITSLGFPAVNQADITAGRILKATAEKPLAMRYVLGVAVNSDGDTVRRKFYVGAPDATAWTGAAASILAGSLAFSITARIGERRFTIPQTDTGITDGDVDNNITV